MSDVKVVRHLLVNDIGLMALVSAASVVGGIVPQGTLTPAIGVSHVSTMRAHTVSGGSAQMCTSRVQVTVIAPTYPAVKMILAAVRAALPRSRGTVAGVAVDSILSDIEGPDFSDEAGLYMSSHDFIVRHTE